MALSFRLKVTHSGPLQGRLKVAVEISSWVGNHVCSNKIFFGTPPVLTYLSCFASVLPQSIVHSVTTSLLFFSSQLKTIPLTLRRLRHSQIRKINKYPCTTYVSMSAGISDNCLKFVRYLPYLQDAGTVIFLQ